MVPGKPWHIPEGERETLVPERETLVPAGFFDQLWATLDADPELYAKLEELARQPRAFERGDASPA